MEGRQASTPVLWRLVRRRRLHLDLSQRAAADIAGVSLATWQEVEREGSTTRFRELTLTRVASALDLPVDEVFTAAGRHGAGVGAASLPHVGSPDSRSASPLVDDLAVQLRLLADRSPAEFMLLHRFVSDFVAHFVDRGRGSADEPSGGQDGQGNGMPRRPGPQDA